MKRSWRFIIYEQYLDKSDQVCRAHQMVGPDRAQYGGGLLQDTLHSHRTSCRDSKGFTIEPRKSL